MVLNKKLLVGSILFTNILGFIFGLISRPSSFSGVAQPVFVPPSWVFIVVWIVLYTILGISFYLILRSKDSRDRKWSIGLYFVNLVFNYLWVVWFFNLKLFLFSYIWLIVLIGITIVMIYFFYRVNKWAGIINVPYLVWIVFASIINIFVFYLN